MKLVAIYPLLFIKPASSRLISFYSYYWLYACLPGLEEKLYRPVHRPVIGNGQGIHSQISGSLQQVRNLGQAIQKRILSVTVKVYKIGHIKLSVDLVYNNPVTFETYDE